ncbi:MAG: hypothetical protein WBD31_32580 [Rubripirellula sp.]
MSETNERISRKLKFSLSHLLTLTAMAALSISVAIAYRTNETLNQSREELLSLSSLLRVNDEDELTHVSLPRFANGFETWDVHVPAGLELELRFGIGEVSKFGIPAEFDRVALPGGRHRITLHAVTLGDDKNRFVVYLDGKEVIDKSLGPDWMSSGWSSSRGMSWPLGLTANEQTPRQLAAQRYTPRADVGKNRYFNGSDDVFVTGPGYRLWIDQPDRTYQPASPFIGFQSSDLYHGIGLRDGLRYKRETTSPCELTFVRPKSRGRDPVLRIVPEFIVDGQTVLSSQTPTFRTWQLHSDPDGKDKFQWTEDPQQTVYHAFLHATFKPDRDIKPVIELKWDADRPNDVGLRLAKTIANRRFTGLRLKIIGGSKHLWRIISAGEQEFEQEFSSITVPEAKAADLSDMTISLDPVDDIDSVTQINWQTDQTLPLQIVKNSRDKLNPYGGVDLYQGLPLAFAARIPKSLEPSISVTRVNQHPYIPEDPFPGGAVFDEIQIEIHTETDDWIWLQAKDRETTP